MGRTLSFVVGGMAVAAALAIGWRLAQFYAYVVVRMCLQAVGGGC